MDEARKIFRILPTQLLAIVHPIIRLEDGVDAERPCAEDRVGFERTENCIQARVPKAS